MKIFNSVCASAVQYLWVERRPIWHQFYWANLAPILLDQFGTNSTGPIWHQFYWTNLAPILLDQFGTSFYWTNSTRLRLLFEFLNPSLRSLHLFDGSVQLPFGVDPPLANSSDNSEQPDDGQQVNCNHFLRLLSNLFCSLRTLTQSSCRIHSGRDNRVS